MKRLHLHVGVEDLDEAIRFYTALFAQGPTTHKDDYAKWMLEDPRVNFAISTNECERGFSHAGIESDDMADLAAITQRLEKGGYAIRQEDKTTCCYAHSDKTWVNDPSGVSWENFVTSGASDTFYADEKVLRPEVADSRAE